MYDIRNTFSHATLTEITSTIPNVPYPASVFKEVLKSFELVHKKHCVSFNAIRSALTFILKGGLRRDISRLYVPAFICPIIPEVAKRLKIKVVYMDVDLATLQPTIPKRLTEHDAIFINHTFGHPLPIPKTKALTISDNAGALFSTLGGKPAGASADVVLYHFSKQLPGLSGCLMVSDTLDTHVYEDLPRAESSMSDISTMYLQRDGFIGGAINIIRRYKPLYKAPSVYDATWTVAKASILAEHTFLHQIEQLEAEVAARRKLAPHYVKALAASKACVIEPISEAKSSYMSFPVRILDVSGNERDALLRALRSHEIFGDRMWYNAPCTSKTPHATLLSESVIHLPIKGHYSKDDAETICSRLLHVL